MTSSEVIQSTYYRLTSEAYDEAHLSTGDEHYLALHYLSGLINFHGIKTILDVGAGTGRVAIFLKKHNPGIEILSIEPNENLRKVGHKKGIKPQQLVEGSIYKLDALPNSIDLVCAFGVFHHLAKPQIAIAEMMRVSKYAIFVSDINNFGQGALPVRSVKQILKIMYLWPVANFIKTKGKRYTISEGDGLAYSFSIYGLIKILKKSYNLFPLSTVANSGNIFRSASHLAIFATKK